MKGILEKGFVKYSLVVVILALCLVLFSVYQPVEGRNKNGKGLTTGESDMKPSVEVMDFYEIGDETEENESTESEEKKDTSTKPTGGFFVGGSSGGSTGGGGSKSIQYPPPTHKVCDFENEICIVVEGEGDDECTNDEDCYCDPKTPGYWKNHLSEAGGLLQYQDTGRGGLTGDWGVGGNEISPGTVRAGGFRGSGTATPPGSSGTLAIVSLTVIDSGYDGEIDLCITNYVDDIAGMTPEPYCISSCQTSIVLSPNIYITCSPNSGGPGTILTIPISIDGNTQVMDAFGLDLTYDRGLLDCVHENYDVFDYVENRSDINYVLECEGNCSNMFNKLKKFLLATILNICADYFDLDDAYGGETIEYWIEQSIAEVENGESENDEYYKNALDDILNGELECNPERHTECNYVDMTCDTVLGSGGDECQTYDDCFHDICDYSTFTCEERPITETGDACTVDSDCYEKVCDYGQQICKEVEPGTPGTACETWDDCLFCGDGEVTPPEECELPGTTNNLYCSQTTSGCSGNKLGTRDAYGNCDLACGCVDDPFSYSCVEGACGAECDEDSDCPCPADGCYGTDWYEYPDYGVCMENCMCDTDETPCYGPCKPVITPDDPRCTHYECDYVKKACLIVEGSGGDECSTYDDCIHTECDYEEEICLTIDSPGGDECETDDDCVSECIPPYLEVEKEANPTELYCEESTITLTIEGKGEVCDEHYPVDVVLIFDNSGSMDDDGWDDNISDWQPIGDAKIASKTFVDFMGSNDKVGLVSFNTNAKLEQGLTLNKNAVKSAIDGMSAGGWTNMSEGIDYGNHELVTNGRTDVPWVEVLLSDGNNNCGSRDPPADCHQRVFNSAQEAADNGIVIYTISLGETANQSLMEDIANLTGGKSYYAPDSEDLEEIYEEIAEEVITTVAGTNVVVIDYLPDYVELNESSLPVECEYNDIERKITCELGTIDINETLEISFSIYLHRLGYNLTNVYPDSGVEYLNYNETVVFVEFPETYVNAYGCEHTFCNYVDMICETVVEPEPGDDECETFDDCPHHKICDYEQLICKIVEGSGTDECQTYDDCFHDICDYSTFTCEERPITEPGDACTVNSDCYDKVCDYGQQICEEVEPGTPGVACNTYDDCIHNVCEGMSCVVTGSPGTDDCVDDYDCTDYVCNYNTLTCDAVAGTGQVECTDDDDCKHYVCNYDLEICEAVAEDDVDECETWDDCYFCGNGVLDPGEECEISGDYAGWGPWGHEYTCKEDNTYYHCINCKYQHVNECEYYCSGDIGCDGHPPMTYLETCDYGYDYLQDYCNEICELEDNNCESDYLGCTSDLECDELEPNTGDCNYMCQYKPSHMECNYQKLTCELVGTAGEDECATFDDCEQHMVCDYVGQQCKIVEGSGTDECQTYDDCFHDICDYSTFTCEERPITEPGDACTVNSDCYDKVCDYGQQICEEVEPGTPGVACNTYDDCIHNVCEGMSCVVTGSPGTDDCVDDYDCTDYVCNYNTLTCDAVAGSGYAECSTFADCPQHRVCDYEQFVCKIVEGTGTDECQTWEDCAFCGDGYVNLPEECELPGTTNNLYCSQTTSGCSGNKLGTRDAYGNCDLACGCVDDPFSYSCVEGACGAECDSNDDCDCPADVCDYYNRKYPTYFDFPDYSECSLETCSCADCEATENICDPVCMGDCQVEVRLEHSQGNKANYEYPSGGHNPSGGTYDITLVIQSNGQCDGWRIPIKYWWCQCPNFDPDQEDIEYSVWSPKWNRLCTTNAGNPNTDSLYCAPCEWRTYVADYRSGDDGSEIRVDTDVGIATGTYQIDIAEYHDCYDKKAAGALGCAGHLEDQPTHLECNNKACQQVAGAGTDQCNKDSDCYFFKCVDQSCVKRAGAQADQCSTDADCVTETHTECSNKACVEVSGSGTDECSQDCDCYFYKCVDQACVKRAGTQADQCSVNSDCVVVEYHNECIGNLICESVMGPGTDKCTTDKDCGPIMV